MAKKPNREPDPAPSDPESSESALDQRVIVPMTKEMVEKIDDFRYAARMPSRAVALRKIIEAGLAFLARGRT